MQKKLTSRIISALAALCMLLALFPATAFAADDVATDETAEPAMASMLAEEAGPATPVTYADGDVAKIGDTTYTTLDDAIAAAADGATIELLGNATTNGMNLSKDLTITAATGLSAKPTITFTQYGIALWGKALTFKDVNVVMNGIGSTPYTAEWNWQTICASIDASLTLDNVDMTMDATGTTNSPHAIYFCNNNVLNIINGSNLTIKNYANDALEWDGGNGGYNVNITDSTFLSDHNRSGFTGTFYATITNSDVDVVNSTGNGSNGSHFIIKDSTVDFNNNGSHGISAGELVIDNSTVNTNNNHGMGISVNNGFTVKNGSIVTVTGNADNSSYGYAAVRLYNNFNFSVDGTSRLYIKDNNNTGLYVRQGNLNVADGAVLEITGNKVTHNALGGYGGGIYVGYGDNYDPTVVLPATAKIYNNHAITGGDDIYVSEGVNGPSLTFGKVGTDWALDGDPDCEHAIDGWYDDSEGTRWEAHADTDADETNHIVQFEEFGENGLATVTGLTQLKAAHGENASDKTSFPGMEKKVGIADSEGNIEWKDSESASAGEDISFKLTTNVPDDLKNYIIPDVDDPAIATLADVPIEERGSYTLTIHDQMEDALVLDAESIQVVIDRGNGAEDVLIPQDQYTIEYGVNHDDSTVCDFEITIDLINLYEVGAIDDDDIANATDIIVTYTAAWSEDVVAGKHTNTAWVNYENGESEPSTVIVYTYGINVFKYDQATVGEGGVDAATGLSGAKFDLYGEGAVQDGKLVEGAKPIRTGITSGVDGHVTIGALKAGTYYLIETLAPDGYLQSDIPLQIDIPDDADSNTYIAKVSFANSKIPHTGGTGTLMYTVGGAAIIVLAGVLFFVSRKSRKGEDR